MSTVAETFIDALRKSALFNTQVQAAPQAILWTDGERLWEPVIAQMRDAVPELLTLGEYEKETRQGPAIWIRCAAAGELEEFPVGAGHIPVLYIPGYSRQAFRDVEHCPEEIMPLVEMQYRGVFWTQDNGKDWTPGAFIASKTRGLGLDLSRDQKTRDSLQRALSVFLKQAVERLPEKQLDTEYFDKLLAGDDLARELLLWLDDDDKYRTEKGEGPWNAFVSQCQSKLGYNIEVYGAISVAEKLAEQDGEWAPIWQRYTEAPKNYPGIPVRIRQGKQPDPGLFSDASRFSGWPQWNDAQENTLQLLLASLGSLPEHDARKLILEAEEAHGLRRSFVWAQLGESRLAQSLEYLAKLVKCTEHRLGNGTIDDLVSGYREHGWDADFSVLKALSFVENDQQKVAVTTAITSVYLPWLQESARYLQKLVSTDGYPGGTVDTAEDFPSVDGECVLFVDGLRYDLAMRLIETFERGGLTVATQPRWAALPSVTATAKPAVSPARKEIRGPDTTADFYPNVANTGQSLKGGYHLKQLITKAGWTFLEADNLSDGSGRAWYEAGNIDHEGHERQWKLGKYLNDLLKEVVKAVKDLQAAGWQQVRIVTDHGWLLIPGGLPTITLPSYLAENKWGRCAVLKSGVTTQDPVIPWFWNPSHQFVFADGVSSYRQGLEYTHGGVSLQECLTPELVVSSAASPGRSDVYLDDDSIDWRGLRCTVTLRPPQTGYELDLRLQPGDESTSIIRNRKAFNDSGTAAVLVENEDYEGKQAFVVVIDTKTGKIVAQREVTVGGRHK
jgi:hypothetical protein